MSDPILDDFADLVAELRALDPAAERVDGRALGDIDDLVDAILAAPARPVLRRRRPRPRLAVAALVTAAVLVVTGTAAAVLYIARPSQRSAGATCYASAALDAAGVVVPAGVDPVAACESAWHSGLVRGVDPTAPPVVPPLVACVTPTGAVGVYPGTRGTCARLGLPESAPPDQTDAAEISLVDQLVAATGGSCAPIDGTVELARTLFDELGLDGWTAEARSPERPDDRCARIAVDPERKAVVVVGGPPP